MVKRKTELTKRENGSEKERDKRERERGRERERERRKYQHLFSRSLP